jgi:hypothetical protein
MCRLSRNPGALTARTPQGHAGLFRDYFTFAFTYCSADELVPTVILVDVPGRVELAEHWSMSRGELAEH